MSQFSVEIRRIVQKDTHPNADTLDLYRVEGIDAQIVSGKEHQIGDPVVFCPVDSVLPEALAEKFGLKSPRIKVVKLRNEYSQGFIFSPEHIRDLVDVSRRDDISKDLGIYKHISEEIVANDMVMTDLPSHVPFYDIENAERYKQSLFSLYDSEVVITEKLNGTNWSCALTASGAWSIHNHKRTVAEGENIYWEAAAKQEWRARAEGLLKHFALDTIVIYGELIGPKVQGNYYKLPERDLRIFDIRANGAFVSFRQYQQMIRMSNRFVKTFIPEEKLCVPRLYHGALKDWLGVSTFADTAIGLSQLSEVVREGVVIKPTVELEAPGLGRLILKIKSTLFLEKEK